MHNKSHCAVFAGYIHHALVTRIWLRDIAYRAPHTFRKLRMIRNFTFVVQRPDRPDYRLAPIGQYGQVEVIFRLQRPLVRDYRVSVDNCRVQQTNAFTGRTLEENSLIIVRRFNVSAPQLISTHFWKKQNFLSIATVDDMKSV